MRKIEWALIPLRFHCTTSITSPPPRPPRFSSPPYAPSSRKFGVLVPMNPAKNPLSFLHAPIQVSVSLLYNQSITHRPPLARSDTMTEAIERSLSALSLTSSKSEDWDRSQYDISRTTAPCTPSPRRRRVELPSIEAVDGTPSRRSGRSLSDLLRLHAENGKDLTLNQEEESRLSEALATWVRNLYLITSDIRTCLTVAFFRSIPKMTMRHLKVHLTTNGPMVPLRLTSRLDVTRNQKQ